MKTPNWLIFVQTHFSKICPDCRSDQEFLKICPDDWTG
jgi:hypothetical protein